MDSSPPIDLRFCEPGDKLLSCHGEILEYVEFIGGKYPHKIRYKNGSYGTRLDNGQVSIRPLSTDHDIVRILKK